MGLKTAHRIEVKGVRKRIYVLRGSHGDRGHLSHPYALCSVLSWKQELEPEIVRLLKVCGPGFTCFNRIQFRFSVGKALGLKFVLVSKYTKK